MWHFGHDRSGPEGDLAVDGFGVAALLAPMLESELASGKLFKLDYCWTPTPLEFTARYDLQSSSVVTKAAELAAQVAAAYIP